MTKITEITPEQLATFPSYVERWVKIGLDTTPANREAAEEGVRLAYTSAGLTPPSTIVWETSPWSGAVLAAIAANAADVPSYLKAVKAYKAKPATASPSPSEIRNQVYTAICGQYEAGWLSFYSVLQEQFGLTECDKLNGIMQVAQSAGWWWAFEDLAIITERPTDLQRDNQGRMHNPTGKSITYPDGEGVWCWHGVRVPRELIEGKWTIADIHANSNTEIRRAAVEHMGWDRYIEEAQLELISEEVDPGNQGRTLKLYKMGERLFEGDVNLLIMINGSPDRSGEQRVYAETVPVEITNALESAAWQYSLPIEVYKTLARRT